jgi:hypothetical protein
MEAEDLSVAIPISRLRFLKDVKHDPDLQHFISLADSAGIFHLKGNRFFPVLNEEMEIPGSALLGSFLGREGADLSFPFSDFGHAVQSRGGVADSEKATSLEFAALAAVGACQTIGIANNQLWRSGWYSKPWGAWPDGVLRQYPLSCSGFVQAGFDCYAALLNMGFPLKLSAGSASGVHPVPPGWSRVYVHCKLPLTPSNWLEALKQGRSFVTTGPIILLRVNGKEPGDEVRSSRFPLRLDVRVEMLSLNPVSEAEVVVNGVQRTVALRPDTEKKYRYVGSAKLTIDSSAWIAARWSASRANGCDVAHTSPIYFWDDGKPIPTVHGEAQALLDSVNRLIDELSNGNSGDLFFVDSEDVRRKTLEYLEQARDVYRLKVNNSLR